MSEMPLKCIEKKMKSWFVLNVLYELYDDDFLRIETCSNVGAVYQIK
jgi:hypothetical protein